MRKKSNHIQLPLSDKIFRAVALVILALIMVIIIYPIWFVLVASFTNPLEIYQNAFLFWPKEFNFESYKLVFKDQDFITGFVNSIFYTVVGTTLNVVMNICGAYPLSKRNFKGKSFFTIMFTFTMFFSGGLIPTYLVVDGLGMRNTIWAILIPSAVSMYNIIIVLPLSIPIIAVIALYYGVGRWNDYFSAMIYITDRKLYPLQLVLREILLQNQASDMMDIVADSGYSDRMMARLGLKYAVIVVSTVPIFVIYPLVQKFFAKGVMVGAIKG